MYEILYILILTENKKPVKYETYFVCHSYLATKELCIGIIIDYNITLTLNANMITASATIISQGCTVRVMTSWSLETIFPGDLGVAVLSFTANKCNLS